MNFRSCSKAAKLTDKNKYETIKKPPQNETAMAEWCQAESVTSNSANAFRTSEQTNRLKMFQAVHFNWSSNPPSWCVSCFTLH